MAVKKKMKNWTRKMIQENYDFELLPKNEIMSRRRSSDRISELPDDLMRSILSLLTPREAAVAASLSSSWRRLDVGADDNVVSIEFPYPSYHAQQPVGKNRFLECTNAAASEYSSYKAMAMAKGKVILKFKFDLSCYDRYFCYIDLNLTDWLKSALLLLMSSSSMEVVDIHVIYARTRRRFDYDYDDYYHHCPNPLKIIVEAEEYCRKLREVSLSGDGLNSSDIDLLLSNLVALERLSIEFVPHRDHLYIGGPETKTKLKHLKITRPNFLITDFRVFISHLDNLVSLSYNGLQPYLDHVPKLVDATIHSGTRNVRDILPGFAAQLLRLRLYFSLVNHKTMRNYRSYGHFTKLEHLELNVEIDSEINIQCLYPLIETFPCIHQLKVKFLWLCDPACGQKRRRDEGDPMMNRMSEMTQLQVVRMSGCVGSMIELEFALYVISNASSLRELVLERRDRKHPVQSRQIDRAFQHLLSVAPSYVDLILL